MCAFSLRHIPRDTSPTVAVYPAVK
eukprot:COSAG03_NODE_12957_length_523_cov_1.337264_1_plen_24_part_10